MWKIFYLINMRSQHKMREKMKRYEYFRKARKCLDVQIIYRNVSLKESDSHLKVHR